MSSSSNHEIHVDNSLSGQILKHTEVPVQKCYQCGKCSAGCPVVSEMDYPPSLILRMLQTGSPEMEEKVLRSYSIWLCLSCEQCISRCPMEIDIPKMMDFLRQMSYRKKMVNPKAKNIVRFHKAFLDSIRTTGRLYELGLTVDYKLRSLKMTQDVALAPSMITKGKLGMFPEMIKGTKEMAKIFSKTTGLKSEDEK